MARPISRASFILGKYTGLTLTLFINSMIMMAVFLLTVWFYRMPITVSLFQAMQLIFVELLVVTAIALFFSTFSSSTLSAILTLGFYVIGHLTVDLKEFAGKSESEAAKAVATFFYYAFPNLEMLNIKGQAAVGIPVGLDYLMLATLYGLVYAAVIIMGACLIFVRRDF
jgi:ABC-type transport system involved in multi-copper enzyme maturation permease subunit